MAFLGGKTGNSFFAITPMEEVGKYHAKASNLNVNISVHFDLIVDNFVAFFILNEKQLKCKPIRFKEGATL